MDAMIQRQETIVDISLNLIAKPIADAY